MDATPDRAAAAWPGLDAASPFGLSLPAGQAAGAIGKAVAQEMTALLAARLRADADTVLALGACTTLTDIALLQQRWLTEAGQAYAEATQRLVRLATDAAKPAAPGTTTGAAA